MASIGLSTEQPDFEAAAIKFVQECTTLESLRRDEVGILVHEMVTNVHEHADATEFVVHVEDDSAGIRVSATHAHNDSLEGVRPGSGFRKLNRLALGWGHEYRDSQLTVWFVIRQPGTVTVDASLPDKELFEMMAVDPASASDTLIRRHTGLATRIARRYQGKGIPDEDLDQVALMALLKAIQRYDPEYGDIRPYAAVTISGELKRKLRDAGWDLNVPRSVQRDVLEVGKAIGRLAQGLGRRPTDGEVAAEAGLDDSAVAEAMKARHAYEADSLEGPDSHTSSTHLQALPADSEAVISLEDRVLLEEAISVLPYRQRWILDLRVNHDMTQAEIAEIVGISQMHVSRLLAEAVDTMQEHLGT